VPDRLDALDTRLLVAMRTHGHTSARDRAIAAFSKTGEHAACWLALGAAAAAAIDGQRRGQWLRAAGVVAASYVANTALKFGIRRLYLSVHYPSDVVAGALLGTALAIGVTRCR
jgi:hypothetical protein